MRLHNRRGQGNESVRLIAAILAEGRQPSREKGIAVSSRCSMTLFHWRIDGPSPLTDSGYYSYIWFDAAIFLPDRRALPVW